MLQNTESEVVDREGRREETSVSSEALFQQFHRKRNFYILYWKLPCFPKKFMVDVAGCGGRFVQ